MGRTHALSGTAAWATAVTIAPVLGVHPRPGVVAAGMLAAAGAALLPDIDHPDATISHLFGPVSHAAAVLVERVSGGHRHSTHSLAFAAVCAGTVWLLGVRVGVGVAVPVMYLLFAFGLRALRMRRPTALLCAGAATVAAVFTASTSLAAIATDSYPWLALAVALGTVAHLLGDCLTPEGCPLLWPMRRRCCLPLISHTDNRYERYLFAPCFAAVTVALMVIR